MESMCEGEMLSQKIEDDWMNHLSVIISAPVRILLQARPGSDNQRLSARSDIICLSWPHGELHNSALQCLTDLNTVVYCSK